MDGQNEIKEIDRLILKYLEGEASKDEKIALYRWIELSEENKTHFKEAQELWLSTQAILAPKEDTEKALQRFRSKIIPQTTLLHYPVCSHNSDTIRLVLLFHKRI